MKQLKPLEFRNQLIRKYTDILNKCSPTEIVELKYFGVLKYIAIDVLNCISEKIFAENTSSADDPESSEITIITLQNFQQTVNFYKTHVSKIITDISQSRCAIVKMPDEVILNFIQTNFKQFV
jgi:hypothetical protein